MPTHIIALALFAATIYGGWLHYRPDPNDYFEYEDKFHSMELVGEPGNYSELIIKGSNSTNFYHVPGDLVNSVFKLSSFQRDVAPNASLFFTINRDSYRRLRIKNGGRGRAADRHIQVFAVKSEMRNYLTFKEATQKSTIRGFGTFLAITLIVVIIVYVVGMQMFTAKVVDANERKHDLESKKRLREDLEKRNKKKRRNTVIGG